MSNPNSKIIINEDHPVKFPTKAICDCEGERLIMTTGDPEDPKSIWTCTICGGKTEKKGFPFPSDYVTLRKVLF